MSTPTNLTRTYKRVIGFAQRYDLLWTNVGEANYQSGLALPGNYFVAFEACQD